MYRLGPKGETHSQISATKLQSTLPNKKQHPGLALSTAITTEMYRAFNWKQR